MILLFHKPFGVLSQFTDEGGRPGLKGFIPVPGVYPCGRLDQDSEGLLLLSDEPGFAHRVSHPAQKWPKVYLAQVEGVPAEGDLRRLRQGLLLEGRKTLPAEARLLDAEPPVGPRDPPIRFRKTVPTAWMEIVLREGRNRQVRKMTAAIGYPTLRLVRVRIGPFALGDLPRGRWREATPEERKRAEAYRPETDRP